MSGADLFAEGLVAALVVVAVVLVAIFLVIPLLVAVIEVVVLLLIGAIGVLLRTAFRGRWLIEARSDGGALLRWEVAGWGRSRLRVQELAEELRLGRLPRD